METIHIRHLYYQIEWSDRLIGILVARGTGKTTLLLQRLKLHFPDDATALYISLDDIYFASNSLIALVETILVDRKITIEVGGKAKGRKLIEGVENAFIAADDLEVEFENKIPLWLFGFLY